MRRIYPPAAYKHVAKLVQEHIEAGLYGPGEKLPTIIELAELHNVKQNTAYAALKLLQRLGAITARRGVGYFVSTAQHKNATAE